MIYGPLKVTKLNWLYFDLDSYFATIEQHLDPNLRHKPIAIVPLMSDSTCAIAASFEAKQMGVKTGTKIYEAKRLCPELICVQARPSIYTKYHRLIFAEINKYLCIDHIFSIDEGACKLTGDQSQEEVVLLLAKKIKEGIRKNIGQYITCSIGIAPNRYLAKIATSIQKPNGITVIKPEDITNKLFPLKLRTLPGIGSATFKKLGLAGIDSIQKLYQLNPTQLEAIWGSIHGKKCWYLLRGVDLPVEATKKATIGQSKVIGPDSRDEKLARNVAQQLILKAASRLRGKNLYTSRITLYIRTDMNLTLKESIKTSPLNDSITISRIMLKSWDNLVQKKPFSKVRNVAVSLSSLAVESKQLSFDDLGIIKRKESLSATIDKINKHFGSNTISFGLQKARKGEGSAIAFGYIPEI